MIAKTKQKITWYPDNFNPLKDFFYAMITSVRSEVNHLTSTFEMYLISGEYFYTDKNEKKIFRNFNFSIKRSEVHEYLLKNASKKDGADNIEEAYYNLLLDQMAKDLSNYIQIASGELELQENMPKNLKIA